MANIKTNNSTEMAEVISRSEAFLTKQKKPLLIVLAAIIVIVGGGLLYHNFVSVPKENKASTALAKGQEYFSQGDWQKALNGDGAGFAGFVGVVGLAGVVGVTVGAGAFTEVSTYIDLYLS